MRAVIMILTPMAMLGISCERKPSIREGEINIYLLSDHESLRPLWEVDESTLVTGDQPIIEYADILSYDREDHIFVISCSGRESLKGKEMEIHNFTARRETYRIANAGF